MPSRLCICRMFRRPVWKMTAESTIVGARSNEGAALCKKWYWSFAGSLTQTASTPETTMMSAQLTVDRCLMMWTERHMCKT